MVESKPNRYEYVLGFIAFAAGSVDIIRFTRLGGILASAMTAQRPVPC
jgi:uncharacterized membrane protein YoaK (UPF0700 family)